MKSRVKIAALAIGLAALTLPLKFIEAPAALNSGEIVTQEVERFLTTISDTPPAMVPLFSSTTDWSGLKFTAQGCEATAYTSPAGGFLVERARLRALPKERVSLLFQGNVVDGLPIMATAWNLVTDRLLHPIGLISYQELYLIVLVAPEQCADRLEALDWPENLRVSEG